jgi:putative FmdB family regulatory protein
MPTYEYRCENGHRFEEFQSIVAAPIEICPQCGAKAERLISAGSGVIFKGSGFYATDYGRKTAGSSYAHEKSAASKSESKSESGAAKTDAAPKSDSTPKSETKSSS